MIPDEVMEELMQEPCGSARVWTAARAAVGRPRPGWEAVARASGSRLSCPAG